MSSGSTVVKRTVTQEADGYTTALPGVEIESVRAGRGVGPSVVTDRPPSRFFRAWALDAAHRRLMAETDHGTVTRVAADLGFAHLGCFSGQYESVYGELPSATLARSDVPT